MQLKPLEKPRCIYYRHHFKNVSGFSQERVVIYAAKSQDLKSL